MKKLLVDNIEKIETRVNEMGLTSFDSKIDYFKNKNPEDIDGTLKNLGITSEEDIKDIANYFSDLKPLYNALQDLSKRIEPEILKPLSDVILEVVPRVVIQPSKNIQKALESWRTMTQEIFANIVSVQKSRVTFLYELYKHVHGDVRVYETDIYSVAASWGYSKDEVERIVFYFEQKGYVRIKRALGKAIAGVGLTVEGIDYIESEIERGTIRAET